MFYKATKLVLVCWEKKYIIFIIFIIIDVNYTYNTYLKLNPFLTDQFITKITKN